MTVNQELDFAPEFEAPAVKARLDALLLLAGSVRQSMNDLYKETERERDKGEWHTILAALAKTFASQIGTLNTTTEVTLIWNQFANTTAVARLGAGAKGVLDTMFQRLRQSLVTADATAAHYLTDANHRAATYIEQLFKRRRLSPGNAVSVAPMFVTYDPKAQFFCASATRGEHRIYWALQLEEHSFYEALILDWIFQHEYLSHRTPNNLHLSRSVREVWLTTALSEEHKEVDGDCHMDLFLWEKLRHELALHFRASHEELFGPGRLDQLAANTFFHAPTWFWSLTAEILTLPDGAEGALLVDDLLSKLSGLRHKALKEILSRPWQSLDVTLATFQL